MRSAHNSSLISVVVLILFLSAGVTAKTSALQNDAAAKLLPDHLGNFRAAGPPHPLNEIGETDTQIEFHTTGNATRTYVSEKGERLSISVITTTSDANAYALLTFVMRFPGPAARLSPAKTGDVGTASYTFPEDVTFFKGRVYVVVQTETGRPPKNLGAIIDLARSFSDTLDKGEGDIPVLVKHLPDWQKVMSRSLYAVSLPTLKGIALDQPVLDAVSFEGGAEAVAANYGQSQLVIVEFNTPQLASDNDVRIVAKIQELRKQGQSAPTAYRRVGNYSVFVFNAPDERTANQLIDQVKYQQVVQWLGNRPDNLAERQREFIETTLGVFVSVVKASGIAIVLCVAVGGFLGALLFSRRRARQAEAQAYSDAGGMLRLNIDELSAPTDAGKLIEPGNG